VCFVDGVEEATDNGAGLEVESGHEGGSVDEALRFDDAVRRRGLLEDPGYVGDVAGPAVGF
jgi:hypothetical protein